MAIYTKNKTAYKASKDVLNIKETAEYLGISVPTLMGAMRAGEIPFKKIQKRKYLFHKSTLIDWLNKR